MKKFLKNYLEQKTLFITGASSGIGFALAKLCLENGAFVIATGRSLQKLNVLKEFSEKKLLIFAGDLNEENFYKQLINHRDLKNKKIDMVVHCAGVSFRGSSITAKSEVYEYLMNINFFSAVKIFSYFHSSLLASQGIFAAVVSMQGLYAIPNRAPYIAAKHALRGYLNGIRRETMDSGIHIMSIYPGYVASMGSMAALTEDGSMYGKLDAHRANGIEPEKVAEEIIKGMYFKRRNIHIAGIKETMGYYFDRFFPHLLDEFFGKNK